MAEPDRAEPETGRFRLVTWPWLAAGLGLLLAAFVWGATIRMPDSTGPQKGQPVAWAVFVGLAGIGLLLVVVAVLLRGERIILDDEGVEHLRPGRPPLRIPWDGLTRVTLHKSARGGKGAVELWGAGRTIMVSPRFGRFDRLEHAILTRAHQSGAHIRDWRS